MFNEKRFRLKVHQYGPGGEGEGGGGSPGGPGGPGGTGPSGSEAPSGFGGLGIMGTEADISDAFGAAGFGGTFGNNTTNLFLSLQSWLNRTVTVDNVLDQNPFTWALNRGVEAVTGTPLSGFAQPAPGDPGPTGGPGGYNSPVSQTTKAITKAVAPPAPVAPPPSPSLEADRRRKRVGRQETILTSRSALSDAPTYSPTLLGQ